MPNSPHLDTQGRKRRTEIPVAKLIEELQKYPPDALAYAYDGEFIGIVIVNPEMDGKGGDQLGAIPASEWDEVGEKYIRERNNLSS